MEEFSIEFFCGVFCIKTNSNENKSHLQFALTEMNLSIRKAIVCQYVEFIEIVGRNSENLVKVMIDECGKLCENKYIWCREKSCFSNQVKKQRKRFAAGGRS